MASLYSQENKDFNDKFNGWNPFKLLVLILRLRLNDGIGDLATTLQFTGGLLSRKASGLREVCVRMYLNVVPHLGDWTGHLSVVLTTSHLASDVMCEY
jgi:hypothetical protein